MTAARLDEGRAENAGVLAHLHLRNAREHPLCARPDAFEQPYLTLGSHPDVVERVWIGLGAELPEEARCVVLGCPALVEPAAGVVLALALGTAYALRVSGAHLDDARAAGLSPAHAYVGSTVDAEASFGSGWLFGAFRAEEPHWVAAAARELS